MATLDDTHAAIAEHLADMSGLFKPGCKLTFIMRNPAMDDCFMVVGDDEDFDAIKAVLDSQKDIESKSIKDYKR